MNTPQQKERAGMAALLRRRDRRNDRLIVVFLGAEASPRSQCESKPAAAETG